MPELDQPLFSLEDVAVARGGRTVLGPVSLELPGPGPVGVVGPSGSGKSTLLRLLNRLDAPTAGTVRLAGVDVATTDPCAHRRRVAMVFQRPVVLPGTVADNLRAAAPDLDDDAVAAALARVGLDADLADRDARELSGGEAQRLGLARSLGTDPEVVLFDEPTSSLDPAAAARIEDLARGLADDGIAVVWVTHDPAQLRRLARFVVQVDDGRITWAGPVDDAPQVGGAPT
ncbi:MAG: ATP-binding cassette domain-containing protein [Acidimicrobiales bacterium]|nr:ATP-binding cassette domain-containing protein [Acidimicrobiales bacterium]